MKKLLLVLAVAVAAVAVPASLDTDQQVRGVVPAAGGSGGSAAEAPNPGVDLVAFDAGSVPEPISPGLVPDGWSVSGDEFALVIAPPGSDTSPADYRGKLVVYLDANTIPNESLPMKVAVDVGERTGFAIRAEPSMLQVWVPQEDGTALRAPGAEVARLGRGDPRPLPGSRRGRRGRHRRRRLSEADGPSVG